jgi:hypothetical protein
MHGYSARQSGDSKEKPQSSSQRLRKGQFACSSKLRQARTDADLVGGMALVAQAAVLLPGGGQAAQLAVLVHRVHDPVNAGVLHS